MGALTWVVTELGSSVQVLLFWANWQSGTASLTWWRAVADLLRSDRKLPKRAKSTE